MNRSLAAVVADSSLADNFDSSVEVVLGCNLAARKVAEVVGSHLVADKGSLIYCQ